VKNRAITGTTASGTRVASCGPRLEQPSGTAASWQRALLTTAQSGPLRRTPQRQAAGNQANQTAVVEAMDWKWRTVGRAS
jgi:hypothetical protein